MVHELVEKLGPQVLPRSTVVPGQPVPSDSGDRPFGEHPRDDVREHRTGLVVWQPARAGLLDGPLRGFGVDPHGDIGQLDQQRMLGDPLTIGDRGSEDVQNFQ